MSLCSCVTSQEAPAGSPVCPKARLKITKASSETAFRSVLMDMYSHGLFLPLEHWSSRLRLYPTTASLPHDCVSTPLARHLSSVPRCAHTHPKPNSVLQEHTASIQRYSVRLLGYKNNAVEEVSIAFGFPADPLPQPFGAPALGGGLAVIP